MFKQLTTVQLPEWSVCYLINGDSSYLEDDDATMIDEWLEETMQGFEAESITFDIEEHDSGFDPFPEFGLACDTLTTTLWGHVK